MKTLLVPKFKPVFPIGETRTFYQFDGYAEVKIKNKPDTEDYCKVIKFLPGIPQGGIPEELNTIDKTRQPIPIKNFYDTRQTGRNKLKKYFITLKN